MQQNTRRPVIAQRAKGFRLKLNIFKILVSGLCLFSLIACADSNKAPANLNMVVSISSDGNYAIATNTNKQAVLWNLKDHSYKIVFKDANIYSAYFIKNTNDFMYQNDANNEVIIENVDGQVVESFNPGFPTFGEVITSDLKTYFGADVTLTLYKINLTNKQKTVINQSWCQQDHNGQSYNGSATTDCIDFRGTDQLLQLQLSPDQKQLIGANFGTLFVWSVKTGKGFQTTKNDAQTVAAINPDGSYVVTGDIMQRAIKVNLQNPKLPYQGFFYNLPWNTNQLSLYGEGASEILAIKFIAQDQLLVFRHTIPNLFNYTALYNLNNIKPVIGHPDWMFQYSVNPTKYLPLISNPDQNLSYQKDWPLTSDDFSRDQAIDTSPSAHILVMSMAEKNGIIVYKYAPQMQTLTREWAGEVKPAWQFW